MQLGAPKIKAPSTMDLLSQADDAKVKVPGFGAVPEREVSVQSRARRMMDQIYTKNNEKLEEGLSLGTHVQLSPDQYRRIPESLRDIYRPGQVVPVGVLTDMMEASEGGDPPKTLNIGGRHTGWNEETQSFDIDYGPAGNPKADESTVKNNPYLANVEFPVGVDPRDLSEEERAEILSRIPGEVLGPARKVANNQIPVSASGRGKLREAATIVAPWINPDWDVTQYESKKRTATEYAGGMTHRNIVAINTLSHHLVPFAEAADALANGKVQKLNELKNYFNRQFGQEEIANFDVLHHLVADEIANVFKTTGATDSTIQNAAETIYSAQSPKQLLRAIRTFARLAEGRIHAVGDKYDAEFGKGAFEEKGYISPDALHVYEAARTGRALSDITEKKDAEKDFDPGGLGLESGHGAEEEQEVPKLF
jgi:hypothetical protein